MNTKFLIIRFSSIGDIVLTSPVVRCLKTQFRNAEIHFLTKRQFADLLRGNPHIDKIHVYDDSLLTTIRGLKTENYNYIIDLHSNLRSLVVKLLLRAKSYSFNKLNFRKMLLVKFGLNTMPDMHIVDREMKTLRRLGINNDGEGLDYYIPEGEELTSDEILHVIGKDYIAIVLAGTYATKQMPIDKYKKLIAEPNLFFVLLGGESERASASIILGWGTANVADFTGKLTINQSAYMIKNAKLVITNDTGLMHIAAAYRKKILSVWGNTVPGLGMYPYLPGEGSEILEIEGLSCRPCSKLGYPECPKKHFNCMNCLPENSLIAWVKANI